MNEHKQNNEEKSQLFKNLFETQMFLYSNEIRFTIPVAWISSDYFESLLEGKTTRSNRMKFRLQFQRNVSVTQLKFLIDAMKTTQQSCVESERVSSKICLNLTTQRLTTVRLISQ